MDAHQHPENFDLLLTGIRDEYTLANTPAPDTGETDQLIMDNFLKTLAEVAVNIASRRIRNEQPSKPGTD
jgi:hypothetical protein